MRALVHNGLVKFLLAEGEFVESFDDGIIIRTEDKKPNIIVSDIPFTEVLVVDAKANELVNFSGNKYKFENGVFVEEEQLIVGGED